MTIKLPDLTRLHGIRERINEARADASELRERFQRIAQRHENGTAPRAVSSFQLFQTPPDLARRMVELAGDRASMCVLEPSAGLGRILTALETESPAEVVAIEVAQQCADELRRRSGLRVIQRDFLTVEPREIGQFDAVIMNPPFHMRADIRHIQHAKRFILPGGVLVALCMDTQLREKALRPLASTWEQIPAGTFRQEGTDVPTILLTIRPQ